jgi:hypothetical protein
MTGVITEKNSSIIIKYYYQKEVGGRYLWHVCGMRIVHREFWLANMQERDVVEDLDIDADIILK